MTSAFKCRTRSMMTMTRSSAVRATMLRSLLSHEGITHARPMVTLLVASHAFDMFRPQPAHHANARFVAALSAPSASAREHAGGVAPIARIFGPNLRTLHRR